MFNTIEKFHVQDIIPRKASEQEGLCRQADFWHLANLVDIFLAYQRGEMAYVRSRIVFFQRPNGDVFIGVKKGFSSRQADLGKITYLIIADPTHLFTDEIIMAINAYQTLFATRQFDINLSFKRLPGLKVGLPFQKGYQLIQEGLTALHISEADPDSYQKLYEQLKMWMLTTIIEPLIIEYLFMQVRNEQNK